MKYLLHVGRRTIYDKINDYPLFEIHPGKAFAVNDDFIANKLIEHKRLEGLVEIPVKEYKDGFPVYDVDGAKKLAAAALKKSREELVMRYVRMQRDDRIAFNKSPLPPSDVVREIIVEEGIDLSALGINISGAGFSIPRIDKGGEEVEALRCEVGELKKLLQQLSGQNSELMKQLSGKSKGGN